MDPSLAVVLFIAAMLAVPFARNYIVSDIYKALRFVVIAICECGPLIFGVWLIVKLGVLMWFMALTPPVNVTQAFVITGLAFIALVPLMIKNRGDARFGRYIFSHWLFFMGLATIFHVITQPYDHRFLVLLAAGFFLGSILIKPESHRRSIIWR